MRGPRTSSLQGADPWSRCGSGTDGSGSRRLRRVGIAGPGSLRRDRGRGLGPQTGAATHLARVRILDDPFELRDQRLLRVGGRALVLEGPVGELVDRPVQLLTGR